MSITEILREVKSLSKDERLQLVERLCEMTEHDVPDSFRKAMGEIKHGESIDLDDALKELDE